MSDPFDDLVAGMDAAMVVVTVAVGGQRDGCLVGFHSQCSIDPPRYAVWLSKSNRTYELASRATHLAVHLLGVDQRDVAEHFGGHTGDEIDKLAGVAWTQGPDRVPLLDAVPSRFVGRILDRVADECDHVCFVVGPRDGAGPPPSAPLRLSMVDDIEPGHAAEERR